MKADEKDPLAEIVKVLNPMHEKTMEQYIREAISQAKEYNCGAMTVRLHHLEKFEGWCLTLQISKHDFCHLKDDDEDA